MSSSGDKQWAQLLSCAVKLFVSSKIKVCFNKLLGYEYFK